MRIHKIDNDRTRRNMYRNAAEYRSFVINTDDIVRNGDDWWRDLIRDAERRMRKELSYKYPKARFGVHIAVSAYAEYDYNRYCIVLKMQKIYPPKERV